ncbi:MAG: sulfatase [Planctomycetota bacterium]
MRVIQLLFDTLCRRMLPPYGCEWTHTPNFRRLAERTVVFDSAYVGSMPCKPARRELHTGRLNFLHRSWGPLEPFDDSVPQMLKENGIYTHLSTDHQHYWEDGGATYHNRYSSYEFFRGQEGDLWKGEVADPDIPEHLGRFWRSDAVNRKYMQKEEDQPQTKTYEAGIEFIQTNHREQNWHVQIETFDPHEPFFTQQSYKDLYPHEYRGPHFDWPNYGPVKETPEQVKHARYEYAALLSMCDRNLGRILDLMDEHAMWDDTLLIVHTDHGFLLGEHDSWAKCWAPYYNEVAHVPLFIWDPREGKRGERRQALVQTIDIPPTVLEVFGIDPPPDMQGKCLRETIVRDAPVRDALLFGQHGAHVNCTDGRWVYMRGPARRDNEPIYNYTLMPTHMRTFFHVQELRGVELHDGFSFTKGCKILKTSARAVWLFETPVFETMLFDLEADPFQNHPLEDAHAEAKMIEHMTRLMRENDAPPEQFERLGL